MQALEAELASVRAANDRLRAENDAAAAEIESLESGSGAVSERARMRLGMIRSDEVLFRLVQKGKTAAPVPEIPEKPTGKQQIFSPKRSDLYVPGSIEDGQEAQQKSRTP